MTTDEAIEHSNSIAVIPEWEFPNHDARLYLMLRALGGEDIYAYHPAGSDDWVLWIRCGNPAHDCRYSIEGYCEEFERGKVQ